MEIRREMKITHIGAVLLEPVPWVLVKVRTDEGITGIGEAYHGAGVHQIVADWRLQRPLIGEDPHTPVETWGMERIFFAHARNQAQHGPCLMDHEEVPLQQGDVDMARCVQALVKAEYDGVIAPEHLGPQSLADAVDYLKKLTGAA